MAVVPDPDRGGCATRGEAGHGFRRSPASATASSINCARPPVRTIRSRLSFLRGLTLPTTPAAAKWPAMSAAAEQTITPFAFLFSDEH